MKINSLLAIFSVFTFFIFTSCDDDLNDIGESIQPPSDTISVAVDTISLQARTVSLDSIYARTTNGVLGQYEDETFGSIKSDYLCQFYYDNKIGFKDSFKHIDSVQFVIDYTSYTGDSLAIMGLSLYQVTSPLTQDFYTNINPANYSNLKISLAQQAYSVSGSKRISSSSSAVQRQIVADLGIDFGQKLQKAIANKTVTDNDSFNKFFPGVYVTTNFGSGSLIKVSYSSIDTYYTYTYLKDGVQRDSTAVLSLTVTNEVIQMNHIQNENPQSLFVEGTDATYLKTPAGVYTEVTFPIAEIAQHMKDKNMTRINSAQFSLVGYTEKESDDNNGLPHPSQILLVNKDSIDSFFKQPRPIYDGVTTFYAVRDASSNVYSFSNITPLINEYKNKNIDKVVYYVVPVEVVYDPVSTNAPLRLSNYMMPGSAVFRNDAKNMKLDLVYSKF